MADIRTKEIEEAIDAGQCALYSLRNAQKHLNSAGNWGLLDIFGGNFITGMMKHSKISDAKACMEQAKFDLRKFQKELDDVERFGLDLEIGDFLTFADFFFDGFIADFMVQSKISNCKKQVEEAIYRVEDLLEQLRGAYNYY